MVEQSKVIQQLKQEEGLRLIDIKYLKTSDIDMELNEIRLRKQRKIRTVKRKTITIIKNYLTTTRPSSTSEMLIVSPNEHR